jgi:hypothetical protein
VRTGLLCRSPSGASATTLPAGRPRGRTLFCCQRRRCLIDYFPRNRGILDIGVSVGEAPTLGFFFGRRHLNTPSTIHQRLKISITHPQFSLRKPVYALPATGATTPRGTLASGAIASGADGLSAKSRGRPIGETDGQIPTAMSGWATFWRQGISGHLYRRCAAH